MDGASTFGRYVCGGILSSVCADETSQSAIFMDSGLCEQYVKSILVANCTSYLDPLSEMDRSNTSIASLKAVTLGHRLLAAENRGTLKRTGGYPIAMRIRLESSFRERWE